MYNKHLNNSWWLNELSDEPLKVENERAYFTHIDDTINPDIQENVSKKRWSNMRVHHYEWIKRQLGDVTHGKKMIDVGCGQSQFKDLYGDFDVCGIDFYPYPGANIITDLNKNIPLKSGTVDVAILSNVLEHIYKPIEMLTEIARVLKKDGVVILVVPFMIKIHQAPFDFHRYTHFCLERMCKDAGFENIRIDKVGNIFDVYDIDSQIRSKLIRNETSGFRNFMVRVLLKLHSKLEVAIKNVTSTRVVSSVDEVGCPQSYGLIARVR